MAATAAPAAAATPAGGDAQKRRLQSEEEVRATVMGRTLTNKDSTFVNHADGVFTGTCKGTQSSGTWTWEDGYCCRSGWIGEREIKPDCQIMWIKGKDLIGICKRGKGSTYRLTIGEPAVGAEPTN